MKRIAVITFSVLLIFTSLVPVRGENAVPEKATQPSQPTPATTPAPAKKPATPGVELAQALTTITGVAISPLMGVGAVGAWKYYATAPQARANLPWYAQPWFWIPALAIVALCALKDIMGTSFPPALKKPFDVIETMEHKVSGLVAAGAFVPLIASVFQSVGSAAPAGLQTAGAAHGFVAVINAPWALNVIAVPAMIAVFLIVCLASNAINILILLSPFPIIDAGLKLFRLSVLALLTLGAFANPWLGAFLALIIITIAWFIAGWSFRLSFFGMVFIWDTCTRRAKRFAPDKAVNWMYLSRKTRKVPVRTYGKLLRDDVGNLVFEYRPWLVLPQRSLTLPHGVYAAGRGLIYSEIVRVEGVQNRSTLLLPPRYRGHEQELAQVYGLMGVRETGLRAAFAWLRDWMGFRTKIQSRPAQQAIPV